MLTKTVVSRDVVAPHPGLLNHIVAGSTYSAAPTVATDGFKIRNRAGRGYDAYEFTYSYNGGGADTAASVRPWFYVPDHAPGGTPVWLAGRLMENLQVPVSVTDIAAPVRRINSVPVGASRMYLQVVAIAGIAPTNLYMTAFGISGNVATVDIGDIQVESPVYTVTAGGAADSADATITYYSPQDFTAVYTSGTTLTLSGIPFVPVIEQFVEVAKYDSSGNATVYTPSDPAYQFAFNSGTGVLTITGAAFAAGDLGYRVMIYGPDKAYDSAGDQALGWRTNPDRLAYDGAAVQLITSAQNLTASWADLGNEVAMGGYNMIAVWVTLDINDSVNARVRVLAKHESGGTEEYTLPIETISASDVKVEAAYFEFNVDADQLMCIPIEIRNVVPYVQVQVQTGTVGTTAGQIDAAYVTRGWA